jgi:hypothetical protein
VAAAVKIVSNVNGVAGGGQDRTLLNYNREAGRPMGVVRLVVRQVMSVPPSVSQPQAGVREFSPCAKNGLQRLKRRRDERSADDLHRP